MRVFSSCLVDRGMGVGVADGALRRLNRFYAHGFVMIATFIFSIADCAESKMRKTSMLCSGRKWMGPNSRDDVALGVIGVADCVTGNAGASGRGCWGLSSALERGDPGWIFLASCIDFIELPRAAPHFEAEKLRRGVGDGLGDLCVSRECGRALLKAIGAHRASWCRSVVAAFACGPIARIFPGPFP